MGIPVRGNAEEVSAGDTGNSAEVKNPDSAATQEPGDGNTSSSTANLRLMYTTDTHGQVTNYDYQAAKELTRGLSCVYTLMKQAREEAGASNYMTFDLGDNIMDYNTDYIYSQDSTALQPVYKAISLMGYDAVTLGNHEFDYGYDYLVSQLEGSGLMNKVILSNVTSKITGDYVFGVENKIVKKEVVDSNGNKKEIKIGLFGVTPPSMSARTESSNKNLKSEDIVACAEREAALLKKKGADIVIALAHSGFGTENPNFRAANADYAMTKIDDVDVVLGGHEHVDFPTSTGTGIHYLLPNVDSATGLVNGKRLMILRDSARGLGIVDLKFKIDADGKVSLDGSDYEIRKVTKDTVPDAEITATMDEWGKRLDTYSSKVLGKIRDGERWQSYTGLMEDSELIQIVHEAELDYASNYVMREFPEYKDYPIISMVRYPKYGADSGVDYSDLSGEIKGGDSTGLANYHRYLNLYELTGQQLKEWLEWSASIYQTVGTSKDETWDNLVVDSFVKETGFDSLNTDRTLMNWSRLFRCEGVEYTIDPTVPSRYNYEGDRISDYERITSLTLNGQAVAPDQKFVMVCEQFTATLECEGTTNASKQLIVKTYNIIQNVICDYLSRRSLLGDLHTTANQNWDLDLPDNYQFMLLTGIGADDIIRQKSWYGSLYASLGDYNYYSCTYHKPAGEQDTQAPGITLSASCWEDTDLPVAVSVLTHDRSGIAEVKYAAGQYTAQDEVWSSAVGTASGGAVLVDASNRFEVKENGIYTVYVKDNAGNAAVQEIGLSNINPDTLLPPIVNLVDNNDVAVTGTGAKGMQICLDAGNKTYTGKIDLSGNFKLDIAPYKANKVLYAYVKDKKGRTSKKTKILVKRVGPNCPLITTLNNNERTVKGNANDKNVKVYAMIGDRIYVSKNWGVSYYKKCKKYNKKKHIIKTTISLKSDGTYSIRIPNLKAEKKVRVFAVDKLGRVSYGRLALVKRVAPNRAKLHTSYSGERYVFGYIPAAKKACYITVCIGKKKYGAYTDSTGHFQVKTCKLKAKAELRVYARDTKASKNTSYVEVKKVGDILRAYGKYKDTAVASYRITTSDKVLKGNSVSHSNCRVYAVSPTVAGYTKIDKYGDFAIRLHGKQKKDTYIYMVFRRKYGALQAVARRKVIDSAPAVPKFAQSLCARDKTVVVTTNKQCKVTVRVNGKAYRKAAVYRGKKSKKYRYTFSVKSLRKGQKVRAYAQNQAGLAKSKWKTVGKARKVEKKAAGKKTTNKKAAGKKTASKKAAGKKTASKKTTSKKTASKKAAGKKTTSKKTTSKKTGSKRTTK